MYGEAKLPNWDIVLQTVIHTVFILSALGIAWIDRISQPPIQEKAAA